MLFVLGKPHLLIAYRLFMGGGGVREEGRKTRVMAVVSGYTIYYVMARNIQWGLWG